MNYSYRCNFCGVYFSSDSKADVKSFKQKHNLRVRNPFFLVQGPEMVRRDCPLVQVSEGTYARPDLAASRRRMS